MKVGDLSWFEGAPTRTLRAFAWSGALSLAFAIGFQNTSVAGAVAFLLLLLGIARATGYIAAFPGASPLRFAPVLFGRFVAQWVAFTANPEVRGGHQETSYHPHLLLPLAWCTGISVAMLMLIAVWSMLRDRRVVRRTAAFAEFARHTSLVRGRRRRYLSAESLVQRGSVVPSWEPAARWTGSLAGASPATLWIGWARIRADAGTRGIRRMLARVLLAFTVASPGRSKTDFSERCDVLCAMLEVPLANPMSLPLLRIRPRDHGLAAFPTTTFRDQEQQLESIELDERCEIRCDAGAATQLAARELLDPPMVLAVLAAPRVYVDITDELVRIVRHGRVDAAELDAMAALAMQIHERSAQRVTAGVVAVGNE